MSLEIDSSFKGQNLSSCLIDLAARFVINLPPEDLESTERLYFHLEEAHWFYEDFVRVDNPQLPTMKMEKFVECLLQVCPPIREFTPSSKKDMAKFKSYKRSIPVRGAILLNRKMTKVVLAKGWGSQGAWGFPRGKISKDETDESCAVREVFEEIGYDISPLLISEDYVEINSKGKNIRLYIVRGVPGNTIFRPQTRKEISKIEWHELKSIPGFSNSSSPTKGRYSVIEPFMQGLKQYIKKANGLPSHLSKTEAKALKNLLGVNDGKIPVAGADEETQAKNLLSLIQNDTTNSPSSANQSPAPSDDRNILLDLIGQNTSRPENQLEAAKEILSLLKTDPQPIIEQQFSLPPLSIPVPQNGIYLGSVPEFPPVHMPPLPPSSISQPPPNSYSQEGKSTESPFAYDSLDGPTYDFNAPPAPPPNPVLMSLLSSRKGKKEKAPASPSKAKNLQFDSRVHEKDLSLNDILGTKHKSGASASGNALLNLLNSGSNSSSSSPVSKEEYKPSAGASLLSLLGSEPKAEPKVQAQRPAEVEQKETSADSISLMSLLKGAPAVKSPETFSQPTMQETSGASLMSLLGAAKPGMSSSSSTSSPSLPSAPSPGANLMNLLQNGSKPSAPPVEASTNSPIANTAGASLLHLLSNSAPAVVEKPVEPSYDLPPDEEFSDEDFEKLLRAFAA